MSSLGLRTRGRITGVLPREFTPAGERLITRHAPGHVEEMRWWLRGIPPDTDAIVMENSAVSPDLQPLAARWLDPTLVVWTNSRPDHQDAWGNSEQAAVRALSRGVPSGCALVSGDKLSLPSEYRASNIALAEAALDAMGVLCDKASAAMRALGPDIADFRVFDPGGNTALAAAFSANDPESAELLFSSLGWDTRDTCALYSDRRDRPARLRSFAAFLARPWREVRVLRGRENDDEVTEWMTGKRVFGCGNVAGLPLRIIVKLIGGGCRWTMPGL